jgi:hypothetical protein
VEAKSVTLVEVPVPQKEKKAMEENCEKESEL